MPDAIALNRVVVDEHDRIEAEIKLLRKLLDVARFVVPVDSPAGKIFCSQDHFGMRRDRFECDTLIVFAHDPEQHPAPCEGAKGGLKIAVCLAGGIVSTNAEVAPAVVADGPA